MRSLVPYVDEHGRQADFLRLGVHGDFVFGFLLRIEEAGYESAFVNLVDRKKQRCAREGGGTERLL